MCGKNFLTFPHKCCLRIKISFLYFHIIYDKIYYIFILHLTGFIL